MLQTLGRSPTVADIAAPIGDGERGTELGEMLGGEDPDIAKAELRVALGPALATLNERE